MLTYVGLPYQTYQLSHSSFLVGLLSLVEVLPLLVVGVVGGALADARDRRRIVIVANVGLTLCAAALVVNALAPRPQIAVLFVVAFGSGVFGALERPALTALVPRVVAAADIPAATALNSIQSAAGQVAGPAVAGVLIGAIGLSGLYALDVASSLIGLVALAMLAAVPPPVDAERVTLARIADGLRYARSRPDLLGTYFIDMTAMFFGIPEALFPQLASHLGGAPVLGVLFSAEAVGSFLVSITSGWSAGLHRRGRAIAIAASGWGIALIGLGFSRDLAEACGALVVAGALDMVSGIMRQTVWNESVPDGLRGRLAGLELVSFSSGPGLGNLESGVAESLFGLRTAIVAGGVACVAATAALALALPALWRYDARRLRSSADVGPEAGGPPPGPLES